MATPLCQCGCGAALPIARYPSQQARFVHGHNTKGKPHPRSLESLASRLWRRVTKTDGCWLFTGEVYKNFGHGYFTYQARNVLAHRVSWELHNGPIPPGAFVLHRCDVPACVRPDHLFLGSQADNVTDMVTKHRNARGEQHGGAKLTEADVRLIRSTPRTRHAARDLSVRLRISRTVLYDVWNGHIWTHVSEAGGAA